jgi:hypothetical protein
VEATNGPAVQSLTWISPHHRPILIFWDFQIEERQLVQLKRPPDSDFLKNGGAHRCALPAKFKPGNGDFDDTPPALHPPFYGAAGGGPAARSNVDAMQSADV